MSDFGGQEMKQARTQLAQGDVLLIPVAAVPKGAKELPRDNCRIVLAYGEVTGHSHAIADVRAKLMRFQDERYLVPGGPVSLVHEEHGTVVTDGRPYRVVQQREYAFGSSRQVAD